MVDDVVCSLVRDGWSCSIVYGPTFYKHIGSVSVTLRKPRGLELSVQGKGLEEAMQRLEQLLEEIRK